MKQQAFFSSFGIMFLGLITVGFVVELLAFTSADSNNCFISPHNRGCENNLPIVRDNDAVVRDNNKAIEKNLERYFISETLSDYFANEVLADPLLDEHLSLYFD